MSKDAKGGGSLAVRSPTKVHLNHLIVKSFNNIKNVITIVKLFEQ
jgi:hypothetical protein